MNMENFVPRTPGCYPDPLLEFGKMVGGGGLGCVLPQNGASTKLWLPPPL